MQAGSPCPWNPEINPKGGEVYVMVMEKMDLELWDYMLCFRDYVKGPRRQPKSWADMSRRTRLPPRTARSIFYQLLKAVHYLHGRPMLHRSVVKVRAVRGVRDGWPVVVRAGSRGDALES
jgi:serine/threonine protein kinase